MLVNSSLRILQVTHSSRHGILVEELHKTPMSGKPSVRLSFTYLSIHLVHRSEVRHISEVNIGLHNVFQARTGCFEHLG